MLKRSDMHVYQEYAARRIIEQEAVALWLFLGAGKTVITLTAVEELLFGRFEARRVLVVGPKKVAETVWHAEVQEWAHLKHLTVARAIGTPKQREAAINSSAEIVAINVENLPWLVRRYIRSRRVRDWPFDVVVLDESSGYKDQDTTRWRSVRKVRPFIRRMVHLTATPSPNHYGDLWGPMYLLDRGKRLFPTETAFREKWLTPAAKNKEVVFSWKLKPGAKAEIEAALADIVVSMRGEDWVKLPKRIDRTVWIELDAKVRAKYDELERDRVAELSGEMVVAGSAAVLAGKLLQLAQGFAYTDAGTVDLHRGKVDALREIVEAAAGSPVLVFTSFKEDARRIAEAFPQARELRGEEEVRAWNRGEIELMHAHPASAGHGINLQTGGHILVWFGLPWSLELYQQANGRLHRQGQKESVVVHHLVTRGTIDEQVVQVLAGKAASQDQLIEALRARVDQVLREIA